MDMIEKVAKAIFDAMDVTDGLDSSSADRYARAAIEAMREPTQEMVEAGQEVNNLLPEDRDPPNAFLFLSHDEMTEAWQAMIDAALVPSPPLREE